MPNIMSTADTTIVGAGKFNRRITIQSEVKTVDSLGSSSGNWTDIVTTWARIVPYRGQISLQADQVYAGRLVYMLIRFRPSLNIAPGMRVKYGKQLYSISNVNVPDETRTTIELLCSELQAKGSVH